MLNVPIFFSVFLIDTWINYIVKKKMWEKEKNNKSWKSCRFLRSIQLWMFSFWFKVAARSCTIKIVKIWLYGWQIVILK